MATHGGVPASKSLEGQQRQLEEECCDWVYFEKITGTKSDCPEFQKLLQEIQTGDTLVVANWIASLGAHKMH